MRPIRAFRLGNFAGGIGTQLPIWYGRGGGCVATINTVGVLRRATNYQETMLGLSMHHISGYNFVNIREIREPQEAK